MPALWFRKVYVPSILRGGKRVTVRRTLPAGVEPGATVTFHVGPRPAFAEAVVQGVHEFVLDDCARWFALDGHDSADEMRAALVEAYGDAALVVVVFRVTRPRIAPGRRPRPRRDVTTCP